jgi:quinol monooxygenase YgiN
MEVKMYGTIAKFKAKPDKLEELQRFSDESRIAPGQVAVYIYQMDENPQDFFIAAVFESREAYRANAASPEQHQAFMRLRALLEADPEWHDGEIVYSNHV